MIYINKELYISMIKKIFFTKSSRQLPKQLGIPYGNSDNIVIKYNLVKNIFFKYNSYNNKSRWSQWYRYKNIRDFLLSLYKHINYDTVYIYRDKDNNIIYNKYDNLLIKELFYRLYYNIDYIPVCKYCHKNPVEFKGERMWKTYCCKKCQNNDAYNSILTGVVNKYNKDNKVNKVNKVNNSKLNIANINTLADVPNFETNRIRKCKNTYRLKYGIEWYNNRDKMKQTKFKHYGDSSYVNSYQAIRTKMERYGSLSYITNKGLQTKYNKYGYNLTYIKEKVKQSVYSRYGVSYVTQLDSFKEKSKNTKLERYGNAYWNNPEKVFDTVLMRYNTSYVLLADEIKAKIVETRYNKYGSHIQWNQTDIGRRYVSYYMSLPGTQNKINETKRKNKTFNVSKPEDECYKLLCTKFGSDNIIRQYKSDLYPYCCDFYIKNNDIIGHDLYIECNFHWTHNDHLYNKNNIKDIITKCRWNQKAKTSKFYFNAIKTWTERDVKKHNIAKMNHLNWLCFYKKSDFDEFLNSIKLN